MYSSDIQPLLRVKQVIDHLKAIDTTTLTETERDAVRDSLQQAYERAAFLLHKERLAPVIESHFFTFGAFGTRSLSYAAPTPRHPNQFFREPLPLKNWLRPRLSVGPTAYDIRLLPEVP
jgi:hypothetical protein